MKKIFTFAAALRDTDYCRLKKQKKVNYLFGLLNKYLSLQPAKFLADVHKKSEFNLFDFRFFIVL